MCLVSVPMALIVPIMKIQSFYSASLTNKNVLRQFESLFTCSDFYYDVISLECIACHWFSMDFSLHHSLINLFDDVKRGKSYGTRIETSCCWDQT